MARTPESMRGGAIIWKFLALGGVATAALVYSMSGDGETKAQNVGAVPRISVQAPPTGYTEEKEKRVPQKTADPTAKNEGTTRRTTPSAQARGSSKKDEFWERGLQAGGGGNKADETVIAAAFQKAGRKSDFRKSNSDCWLPPGAFIPVRSVTRIVTEKPGILKAKVTTDIWDTSGTCLVLPSGSDLVADYGGSVTKGEKRVPVTNMEIVRPFPADDMVTIAGVAGDPHGAAGVPGDVESNLLSTALLVSASVGLDLAQAALTSGGSLIGPIIGENASRPLDQIANDLWKRPSLIQVDERTDMLLILRTGISGDDFRNH